MIVIFLKNDDNMCFNPKHSFAKWLKICKCQYDGGLVSQNTDYTDHAQYMLWSINNILYGAFRFVRCTYIH